MDKVHIHSGMPFSLQKEGNPLIQNKLDDFGGHYMKWNKASTGREITHDLAHTWNQQNLTPQRGEWWLLGRY